MRNPALEQVIIERPDNNHAYFVYGDWLQEQGDPRGELIALQQRLHHDPGNVELRTAEAELIHRKREEILGPLAGYMDGCALKWHLGFIRSVRLHGAPSMEEIRAEEVLAALFEAECAAFLSELTLGRFAYGKDTRGEGQDLLDTLLSLRLPTTLRSLFLFDDPSSGPDAVDLSGIGVAMPQLQRLVVSGRMVQLGDLQLPSLQELSLCNHEYALLKNITAVAEPRFGELESLTVWWDDELNAVEALPPLLDGRLPQLRQLRLLQCPEADEVLEAVLDFPICSQLESLEFSISSSLDDDDAASLATRGPEQLPNLRQLTLVGTDVGTKGTTALETAFPKAVVWVEKGSGGYLQLLGRALCRPETAAAAAAILEQCAGAGYSLFKQGTRWMSQDNEKAALPLLHLSRDLPSPTFHRQAWSNLAIAYADVNRLDESIEVVRAGIARFPYDTNLHAILIDALRHQRKLDKALAAVQVGRPTISDTVEGYALLVDMMLTYLIAGQPAEAVKLYEEIIGGMAFTEPYPGYVQRGEAERQRWRTRALACGALAYVHNDQVDEAKAISTPSAPPTSQNARRLAGIACLV
jgi:uncharacterized protein (TIGR02996 family)